MSVKVLDVLLVEDDEDDYLITKEVLDAIQFYKFNLTWKDSYEEALEEVENNSFDIVLLDYRLGAYTGLDLISELNSVDFKAPKILLTGQTDREIDLEAMKYGATDFIPKSKLDSDVLERSIRYALARQKSDEKIMQLAYYDPLTALPNRRLFLDRLEVCVGQAGRYSRQFAVLFIDMDNFKKVNDVLGHKAGDTLLKVVSERLIKSIRVKNRNEDDPELAYIDTVARLGGDEFTILLSEIKDIENPSIVAKRIIELMREGVEINGQVVNTSTSIGISVFPKDGKTSEELLKAADAAMYAAKTRGKNNYVYYENTIVQGQVSQFRLESDIREAIKMDSMKMYYQPQYDMAGLVTGVEALLRWEHPDQGLLIPENFLKAAEETGCIEELGDFVLNESLEQYKQWKKNKLSPKSMSINLSRWQLTEEHSVKKIKDLVSTHNISPSELVFDIAENILDSERDKVLASAKQLREEGFKVALDGYGKSGASLALLMEFPFDVIKLHLYYLNSIVDKHSMAHFIDAVVYASKYYKSDILAVGIEKQLQHDLLSAHGCTYVQGYLQNSPMQSSAITDYFKESREAGVLVK